MNTPSASPAAEPPQPPAIAPVPTVRFATPQDAVFVEELQALAFGPGRFARTAFRVRERFPIEESLSLIAEINGVRCGSVWMTPISVGGVKGYLLGPLATHPDYRKLGAGKLLTLQACSIAMARGEGEFVLLVGDQDYYCPLGFSPTRPGAVQFPGPVDPSRVLLYTDDATMAQRLSGPIAAFEAQRQL